MEDKTYHDKRGRRISAGAVLKVYHFTGARRKRYFMYKVAAIRNGALLAMDITELVTKGFEHAHACRMEALPLNGTEVISEGD